MKIIEGWEFPIEIDTKTGKIKTVSDNDVVKQSINIILRTQIFERKILKNFGSELRSFMFGSVDPNYISSFKKSIEYAIKTWEKHVQEVEISVKTNGGIISKIDAEIDYVTDINPSRERIKRGLDMEVYL